MLKRHFIFAAVAAGIVLGGCYSPNISPGGLRCAAGGGKPCPDGFVCQGELCIRAGGGATGGAVGTGGLIGTGGMGGTGGAGGPSKTQQEGETCLLMQDQTHDCVAGLTCMDDCANARCYKPCQADTDCPQSWCRPQAAGTAGRVCEVPYRMCAPNDNTSGTCGAGRFCYLLSSQPTPAGEDGTVCDCSNAQKGTGESCSTTRDCFPGLVCPPVGSMGGGFCRRVCDPAAGATGCAATTCRPYGAKWGYCFL